MSNTKIIGKIDLSIFDKPTQVSPSFTTVEEQEMYEENYRLEYELDEEFNKEMESIASEFDWETFENSFTSIHKL